MTAVDIDWSKPSGAALAAAGVKVASLYVGQDNTGKNMTLAVVEDYLAHHVAVLTNFEYGAMQMNGGASQGHADAVLGLSQKRACNLPDSRPIIFSADWPATASEIANNIIPYLVAARGVLGGGNVGVYGSYYVVKAVADYWAAHYPGEKIWLWQTVGWSNGLIDPRIDFYQNGTTITVAGISCDVDEIRHADVGQYPVPTQTPKAGEPMAFIAQFNADSADPSAGSGIFLVDGGKLLPFANANTALAFKNQLGLPWVTITDGPTLDAFRAASVGQPVTVPALTDAQVTLLGQATGAAEAGVLSSPSLLAAEGAAIAHAEAVQQHNDTPAS